MRNPRRFQTPASLPTRLDQQLNLYVLAAGAAGVSLLAFAQSSEAKIVYTPTHRVIGSNGLYPLDLNHDGTIDFLIQQQGYPFSSSGNNGLGAKGAVGNGVQGSSILASALKQGAPIGPQRQFINSSGTIGALMFNVVCTVDQGCSTRGKWINVNNEYLGLKFKIHGKTHYGWARLSVSYMPQGHSITATLTGYAYETIPNQGLRAGQRHNADYQPTNGEANVTESAGLRLRPHPDLWVGWRAARNLSRSGGDHDCHQTANQDFYRRNMLPHHAAGTCRLVVGGHVGAGADIHCAPQIPQR